MPKHLRLSLSPHQIQLLAVDRKFLSGFEVLRIETWSGADPLLALHEILLKWIESEVRVRLIHDIVIDDEWCRYFMVTPPKNAGRASDLRFAATHRFDALFDDASDKWHIDADWSASFAFLACAIYKPLLETLKPITTVKGVKIARVAPNFIDQWDRYCGKLPANNVWVMIVNSRTLVIAAADDQRIQGIHQAPLSSIGESTREAFFFFLEREAIRLNQALPQDLYLGGTLPEAWPKGEFKGIRCHTLGASFFEAPGKSDADAALAPNEVALEAPV